MKRAQVRDAVSSQMFYFRKSLIPEDDEEEDVDHAPSAKEPKSHDHEYTLMNIDTIVNGKVRCSTYKMSVASVCSSSSV